MDSDGPARRPPLIVVEGPNGAGKTTLVAGVAAALGMRAFRYPAGFLANRREHRLDENFSPVARLLSYLAAIAQLSDETWTAVSGDQPSVDVARPALDAFGDLR